MQNIDIHTQDERMKWILSKAWGICIARIASGRININKESSLQLHYSFVLAQLGELACVHREEAFFIELETHHEGKNIDIWCSLGNTEAAVELKCFRKKSNRAVDIDMYDVLKDITRLESYNHVTHRRFICLTDNAFYSKGPNTGHAKSVSIGDGKSYPSNTPITPTWVGKWQDSSRDKALIFKKGLHFNWNKIGDWFYLFIDV